jgi:hypothetical protein
VSDRVPTFVQYICQHARPGERNLGRNEALAYLIDQQLSGLLPRLTLGSSLGVWQEFWEVAPMHLRPALARLWREYRGWRGNGYRRMVQRRMARKRAKQALT